MADATSHVIVLQERDVGRFHEKSSYKMEDRVLMFEQVTFLSTSEI